MRVSALTIAVKAIKRVEEIKEKRQAQFIKNRCVCEVTGNPCSGVILH